jgi:hypothetical protein
MAIEIGTPEGKDELSEFLRFHDRVYASRPVRWEANTDIQLPILTGESPFCKDREIRPFVARQGRKIVARAAAIVDARYQRHWDEPLGHLAWFEALPNTHEAVNALMDVACAWLAQRNVLAARTGFTTGALDFPFCMDAYEALPPSMLRQNPPYYHLLLKRAGFEVEQGFVDYRLRVTPGLRERWKSSVEGARGAGFDLVPLRDLPRSQRTRDLTEAWNDTFKTHWGWSPFSEDELSLLLDEMAGTTVLDTSVVAYWEGEPVGFLFNASDDPGHAAGRPLEPSEKLNVLGIGVREKVRGRGLNYAMAAFSYLELARRGRTHLSYTLVLDHNWPSRRTGEGLGATVCANYLAYRRNFRR